MKLTDFDTKCGVYKITNTVTGGTYIGQTTQFPVRIYEHFKALAKGKHPTFSFQEEFTEYGSNAFTVELLEECTKETLGEREFYYMKLYQGKLYNICMKNA